MTLEEAPVGYFTQIFKHNDRVSLITFYWDAFRPKSTSTVYTRKNKTGKSLQIMCIMYFQ